jgi:hypothetical protein
LKAGLSWLLLAALLAHAGAHVVIAISFARKREWRRAALALLVPPLAPVWGWRAGLRAPVYTWAGGLLVYALGVAAA